MGFEAYSNAKAAAEQSGERQRNAIRDMQDRQVGREAGNALATGDYQGAAGAFYAGGNVRDGLAVQRQGQAQAEDLRERQQSTVAAALSGLMYVPEAERPAMLQQRIAPMFREVGLGDYLSQITPDMLSDASLRAVASSMGVDVEKPQILQGQRGAVDLYDPYTQRISNVREGAAEAPPNGYRWGADGNLQAIPGGPADVSVVSSRAAAGRAPPRGRSGGGSRGGSRSSGAAPAAAAPSRRPWERF